MLQGASEEIWVWGWCETDYFTLYIVFTQHFGLPAEDQEQVDL